jgi:hypothetical protein
MQSVRVTKEDRCSWIPLVAGFTLDSLAARPTTFDLPLSPENSDLQSAFLKGNVRRGGNFAAHFARILTLSHSWETTSLAQALDRLELASGNTWSTRERESRRLQLLGNRHRNLRVLEEYRLRGKFPQDDGAHAPLTPIFVDASNTACAVGFLMRRAEACASVDSIKATNNYVLVSDVSSGPLLDWILTSGLTQEEAALIQPTYWYEPLLIKSFDEMEEGMLHVWPSRTGEELAFKFHGVTNTIGEQTLGRPRAWNLINFGSDLA